GPQQRGQDAHGRGLARAVRAEQRVDRAARHAQIEAGEHAGGPEGSGQSGRFDDRVRGHAQVLTVYVLLCTTYIIWFTVYTVMRWTSTRTGRTEAAAGRGLRARPGCPAGWSCCGGCGSGRARGPSRG